METDNLKDIFKDLNFDIEEPKLGHRDRFSEKLNNGSKNLSTQKGSFRTLWTPILSIAATIALVFLLFGNILNTPVFGKSGDLANVSPEMKQTKEFYNSLIKKELNNLKAEKSPETKAIIADALSQMEKLETEYDKLRKDLVKSGNDNRVIYAMITNFQQRIDLLKNVLNQINTIKALNTQTNENNII